MGDITLSKALDDYKIVYMPYRNFAERTRVEYSNDLEDLIRFFENLGLEKVGEIGLPHLERYLAELDRRGFSGLTRKRKTVVIRSFFSFLHRDGYTKQDVARRLVPPFVEYKMPRVLTQTEYQRLLKACTNNIRDTAIIELLLQTGIRLSELTRLTLSDIELPAHLERETKDLGELRVMGGKRQKGRVVPLNYKASKALDSYLNIRSKVNSSRVFINKFGRPFGERGVEKMLYKYLSKLGIKGATVRSLRHTFGAHHVAKGTSLETIQETMGHKDRRSTLIYKSLANELIRKELQTHAL